MRCFVAIALPADVKRQLQRLQQRLSVVDRHVRWTLPEQMHLTLNFLGEVREALLPGVCDALDTVASSGMPCDLLIKGAGCFPPTGPARIVWAGVNEPPGALLELQAQCEQALSELGFTPEGRSYHPHLTVGRVTRNGDGRAVREAVDCETAFEAGLVSVTELGLYESHLQPRGAVYLRLHTSRVGS